MKNNPVKNRVIQEVSELEERIEKLSKFLGTDQFHSLADEQQTLLLKQNTVMQSYRDILRRRLQLM